MWIINTGKNKIEFCDLGLHKWLFFKPGIPVQVQEPLTAVNIIQRYSDLKKCKNPERYFVDRPMKQMIVRDAGIGDLLLLEPVIRQLRKRGNIDISILSRYPEVYENHPDITHLHKTDSKSSYMGLKVADYDQWDDLRSYSETSNNRAKHHRTDIYNEKFDLKIEDKEPRIYFGKDEKCLLNKKKGYKYIGVSVDASHNFRKYPYQKELIKHIIKVDKKNIVVLFGEKAEDTIKHKQVLDLTGKTTIRQMINYVRGLDYVIAVDSGIMHVALTLHIKTLCLFTIITPDLRLRYYNGAYKVLTTDNSCIGCGDWHMLNCEKLGNNTGIAPCQGIEPQKIYNEMLSINDCQTREIVGEKIKPVNIIAHSTKKITMPIIVQDEEHNLPRFIDNVIKHPSIGRIIAIDGGSKDNTVKLLEKAGAEVYEHKYIKTYHEMQAMQRNISCSYVKDGENILIMDIDECFSSELSEYLPYLAECNDIHYGLISRRTFNYYKDIKDPSKAIKDYPDWQPRFYKWDRKYKFVGGAHHITLNCPQPTKIQKDIIHFEKEGKNRDVIEKQWASMMAGVKKISA
jgi:ADP-heptose:LPS heptosyltransferase